MILSDLFRKTAAVATLLAGVAIGLSGHAAPNGSAWHRDLASATAEQRRLDLPLLLHFYADWCVPCKTMEGEVLSSADLTRQFGTRFVGAKLNLDQNEAIAKQYGVKSLPTDIVVAPDGRVLSHTVGYQSQRDYLSRLARIEADFDQSKKMIAAKGSTGSKAGSANPDNILRPITKPGERVRNVSEPQQTTPDAPAFVGLNGYSPVSLFKKRDWIKGQKEYAAAFEGVVYHFTSTAELDEFERTPEKFSPRLLGCDPVVFEETERAVPGSTRFGAYYDGRLFLFVSSATRDQFQKNPDRFGKSQQTVRVEQIEFRRGP